MTLRFFQKQSFMSYWNQNKLIRYMRFNNKIHMREEKIMKRKTIVALMCSFALSLAACGGSSSEVDALKKENEELKVQIEELQSQIQGTAQEEDNEAEDDKPAEENKVYGLGETWTVDGLWSLTFTSVTQTDDRNEYSDKTPGQVVILNYDYENIGYQGDGMDLYICSNQFQIMDANGEIADTYPGDVTTTPQEIPVGAKCVGAQECIDLNNVSEKIKIIVTLYDDTDDDYTEYSATFELPVQ